MRIRQNWPLDKFMQFLFMFSSVICIVTYGVIKNLCSTNFTGLVLDSHNSHTLKCSFTVYTWEWMRSGESERERERERKREREREGPLTFLLCAHWWGSSLLLLMMFVAAPWLSSTDTMDAEKRRNDWKTYTMIYEQRVPPYVPFARTS